MYVYVHAFSVRQYPCQGTISGQSSAFLGLSWAVLGLSWDGQSGGWVARWQNLIKLPKKMPGNSSNLGCLEEVLGLSGAVLGLCLAGFGLLGRSWRPGNDFGRQFQVFEPL